MKKSLSYSIAETETIAKEIVEAIAVTTKKQNEATVIGLSGHLGSGKTAFVKVIAKLFGVKEEVTSPTFVIMKTYDITSSQANQQIRPAQGLPYGRPAQVAPWKKLVHIDAYRLEEGKQLEVLGFEKLVSDPTNLIMIEWVEQVKEIMPADYFQIDFEDVDGNKAIVWK